MTAWQGLVRVPDVLLEPAQAHDWVRTHLGLPGTVRVLQGTDTRLTYLRVALAGPVAPATLAQWRLAAQGLAATAEVAQLRRTTEIPGASQGAVAPWHYIVETDVAAGVEDELDAWYATEHLPGLAAVPGTVCAQRFVDDIGSPRHHACYDLHTRETFGSPAWLAVRATAWSDRVRPHFRETRRTMFRVVA